MRKFDLITVLLTVVGKLQARRLTKAIQRESNLKASIEAATKGYQEAVKARCEVQFADLSVKR